MDGRYSSGFARKRLHASAGVFKVIQSKMVGMRSVRICLPIVVMLAITTSFAYAGDDENSSIVNFTVIRDYNGKPVRNASVILHSVNKDGKQTKGGAQLKTDSEGKTSYPGLHTKDYYPTFW